MNPKPFLLRPAYKDYLWGGERLKTEYNKNTDVSPVAESWECSIHPDGLSVVASGEYAGETLKDVLDKNPAFLGSHPDAGFGFPLLIKFLDAKEALSLQVHPDDEYAKKREEGEHGKSEMWYVLDAEADSYLVYGFSHDLSREELERAIENETVDRHLNKIPVQKDDVFFVSPGTVHAIGDGVLIAEIQESSNVTYRLCDYGRTDKKGNKRELHIDKALEVVDYSKSQLPRQPLRVLKYKRGVASEFLARCRYFEVFRMLINTDEDIPFVEFASDELSFRVLLCIDGEGSMHYDSERLDFKKGDCVFVPADSIKINISGKATFLDVRA